MVFFSDYYNSIFIDRFPFKHKNWQLHGILIAPFQNSICKKLHFQLKNVKNNHSSTSNLLDYTKFCTKKRHAPSFSKICTLPEFQPEFKPMTKNFQEKLHQEECKQWNVQVFVPVEENLSVKNSPKTFGKLFTRKNMQKTYAKLNKCKTFQ